VQLEEMSGGIFTFDAWQDPYISHQHGTSPHGTGNPSMEQDNLSDTRNQAWIPSKLNNPHSINPNKQ
jgi:hypothetical protein